MIGAKVDVHHNNLVNGHRPYIWPISAALCVVGLAYDLATPLGVAGGLIYIIFVMTGLWHRIPAVPLYFAAISSVLTLAAYGFVGEIAVDTRWVIHLNRGMSIVAIWVVAILVYRVIRSRIREGQDASLLRILRSVVESSEDLILITDAGDIDGGPTITYVNQAAEKITGYRPEELIGKTPRILQGPLTDRPTLNGIRASLEQGKSFVGDVLNYTKSGRPYWMGLIIFPIKDEQGNILHFASIQRDVTDRKTALVQQEKLVENLVHSNAELERFAYVASHDLQEPLRMVSNFTDLLHRRYADKLDEKGNLYINFARDGALRMRELINDLLEYGRTSDQNQNTETFDMNVLVEDVRQDLSELISSSGARISVDTLPTLDGNPVRLGRLLQNLISNAIKYGPTDRTPEVRIAAVLQRDVWQFSVSDNGIGIEPEHIDRIFEPFKRLHRRDKYGGTGMGLAICRKIVKAFGGEIWVESTFGKGSIFFFTVPTYQDRDAEIADLGDRECGQDRGGS